MIRTLVPAYGSDRGCALAASFWRSGHVDVHPTWRLPAMEAGFDLAECDLRRHGRHRLLYDRVRARVLRVAAPPRCDVPQRILGPCDLHRGLRSDPPAVDPHSVGAGLRHRGRRQGYPGADLARGHGGHAADA